MLGMACFVFIMNQIAMNYGAKSYDFFGFSIQLNFIYFSIISLLGCSLYCFAIDFILEYSNGKIHKIGNFLFMLSISLPPLFLLSNIINKIANIIIIISKSQKAGLFSGIFMTLFIIVLGILLTRLFSRSLDEKNIKPKGCFTINQEHTHLDKADEMFRYEYYDLAALEGFLALENALRSALIDSGIRVPSSLPPIKLISMASKYEIFPV
jgi:hypothetical protein